MIGGFPHHIVDFVVFYEMATTKSVVETDTGPRHVEDLVVADGVSFAYGAEETRSLFSENAAIMDEVVRDNTLCGEHIYAVQRQVVGPDGAHGTVACFCDFITDNVSAPVVVIYKYRVAAD